MHLRAVVAMVAGTCLLAAASPAGAGSLEDCGQRVLRDWYSGGRVDKVYPLPCYRAAIRALPDDVLQYTDASTAIERALESARQGTTEKAKTTPDDASPLRRPPRPRPSRPRRHRLRRQRPGLPSVLHPRLRTTRRVSRAAPPTRRASRAFPTR